MSDTAWDFTIKKISLDLPNIDAGRPLGIVIAQPYFDLNPDSNPHFQIQPEFHQSQCDAIARSFAIRAEELETRHIPFPFIVFPEGAIPTNTSDGLEIIASQLQESTEEVIFIGGLEGTSREDFNRLMCKYQPANDNGIAVYGDGTYVNACVIVVKDASGGINWHFQAKLAPSQWEQPRSMAEGKQVLYFQSQNLTFVCQICFDHIARRGQEFLSNALCHRLSRLGSPNPTSLDFVIVPQYNKKPEDNSFQRNTNSILAFRERLFNTDLTAIVAANKAALHQGKPTQYGCCGIHYRGGRWQAHSSDLGPVGYQLTRSDSVTSAIFRKRTEAIHVAELVPTSYNIGDPGNLRQPLKLVRSYLLNATCDQPLCSCLPDIATGTTRFVECDPLPCKLRDILNDELPNIGDRWRASDHNISSRLLSHYEFLREKLFLLGRDRASSLLAILFFQRHKNSDLWGSEQIEAIIEATSALTILREAGDLEFHTHPIWTAELNRTVALIVLDGYNLKHPMDLTAKYLQQNSDAYYRPEYRQKPLLVVALRTSGRLDEAIIPYQPDITRSTRDSIFGQESSPSKPDVLQVFLCKQDFIQEVRHRDPAENFFITEMGKVFGSEQTTN